MYAIEQEIRSQCPEINLNCFLADVADKAAMRTIFSQTKPHVVFHAAAYKHVPILEQQVRAAVKNNILGTLTVAEQAVKVQVDQFILISTDKVVNPNNVMGASKRVAELIAQYYNGQTETQFTTVRFGNVLGSTGSVIPLFRKQIETGGPVTVTHPETTRYFMTIPEAVHLILQAAMIGRGGEIFVLDMGEPVNIYELAIQMIKLSGKTENQDIDIEIIGLRPGEKLHEELFHETELFDLTTHDHIFQAKSREVDWAYFEKFILQLNTALENASENELRKKLNHLVPEYVHQKQTTAEVDTVTC